MSTPATIERTNKKAVTLQDVARRAGTAKSTASMALNGKGWVSAETRELVLRVAKEMNFEIDPSAKRLSLGRDYGTVVLLSRHLDMGVGSEKVQAIQCLLNARGYNAPIQGYGTALGLQTSSQAQVKLIRTLCRERPQAIICNTSESQMQAEARRYLQTYREEGGTLLYYDWPLQLDCDGVIFDREDNTYQAARHLLELGHRKLGIFDAASDQGEGPRLRGFCRALHEYSLQLEPRYLYAFGSYSDCEGGGKYLAEQFLKLPKAERPTAMCIVNDLTALVFVTVLREHGLEVPRDVSVVGHDNLMVAKYGAVPLTTVSQPVETIAAHVVDLVVQRLDTPPSEAKFTPRQIVVKGELVLRQSTAPL